MVKTPQFHGHFGTLTKYNVSKQRRFVYFVRKTADGIPCLDMMEEAISEMPGHFQVGCTSADMLQTLISSISRVSIDLSGLNNPYIYLIVLKNRFFLKPQVLIYFIIVVIHYLFKMLNYF